MIGHHGVPMTSIQRLFKRFGSLDPKAIGIEALPSEGVQQKLVIEVGVFDDQQAHALRGPGSPSRIGRALCDAGPIILKPVRWGHGLIKGLGRPRKYRAVGQRQSRLMVARSPLRCRRTVCSPCTPMPMEPS